MSRRKISQQKYAQYEQETHSTRKPRKPTTAKPATTNVVSFNSFVQEKRKPVTLIPKSIKQEEYVDLLLNPEKLIIFATGPAGTGKTMLAVIAGIKALKEGVVKKIVITRPAAAVDNEQHGFLPGDLNQKMAPWTLPIFDVLKTHYSVAEIDAMLAEEIIEIAPLAFMRGRTFRDCWIIADEMQNSSENQLVMLLTRIGEGSKMVLTGDLDQVDRQFVASNGLKDFLDRYKTYRGSSISVIEMMRKDIQRHPVVSEILGLYKE